VWVDDDQIFSFGRNDQSQLGQRTLNPLINSPRPVHMGFKVKFLATGNTHTFVVDEENQLWGVGYITKDFDFGQSPVKIHSFKGEGVVGLCSGVFHCLVLTGNNKVYGYGQNGYKQVGVQTAGNITSVQLVNLPGNPRVQTLAAGYHHSVVLTDNNKLVVWGAQSHGQLGTETKVNMLLPTLVNSPLKFSNLYITLKPGSFGPVIEESVEVTLPIRVNSEADKDKIIQELRKKNEQQAQRISILEAEIQGLKIQINYQDQSKNINDVGAMKISFTK